MTSGAEDGDGGAPKAGDGPGELTDLETSVAQLRTSPIVAFDKALDNILKLPSHDLTLADDSSCLLVSGTSAPSDPCSPVCARERLALRDGRVR